MSNDVPMTRARVFVLIDAFERDIRQILSRFVLAELSEEDALGPSFSGARARQSEEVNPSDALVDYIYLREGYDLLNSHRKLLPEELAQEVRDLTSNLDRLVGIRKRVMHARPLLAGDSDAAVLLLNMYQTRYWSELKRMVAQLREDPSWEPPLTIESDEGFALHNLPLPDYDETGLIGRSKERDELVRLIKRKREPVLTITGERKFEKEEKDKKYHRVERSYGSFVRSFSVPDDADAEKVTAEFRDGVLKVHLGKAEQVRPRQVEVKVA